MSTNEMMTIDTAKKVIPFSETVEGWKWVGSTLKEVLDQDHEVINRQNEGFMNKVEGAESADELYMDASQHIREIREYKRGIAKDVITAGTIIMLALCGVRSIKVIR